MCHYVGKIAIPSKGIVHARVSADARLDSKAVIAKSASVYRDVNTEPAVKRLNVNALEDTVEFFVKNVRESLLLLYNFVA